MYFHKESSWWRKSGSVSLSRHVWLFVTPWTVAHRAPLSMGFPRQEHQSGLPFPSPDPGIEPKSPAWAGGFFTTEPSRKCLYWLLCFISLRKQFWLLSHLWYPWVQFFFFFFFLSTILTNSTPWTVAYQAPLSMGFSRQGYWSELPFPSPDKLHSQWKLFLVFQTWKLWRKQQTK